MALAWGGISSVNTSSSVTSVAVSGSDTVGIVFVVGEVAGDNITAVTWNGVSMTKIGAVQNPSDRWMSAWWVASPASSTTIAFTGGSFWRSYSFYYTGAHQTAPIDSSNTGSTASASAITIATTVVASNCWQVMAKKDGRGNLTDTGSGVLASTRTGTDAGGIGILDSNGTVGTGSQSGTDTLSGGTLPIQIGGITFSLAPVGGGGGGSVNSNFLMFM